MSSHVLQRLPLPQLLCQSRRSFFSFPSFGSSNSNQPAGNGKGKLRKRGSISIYQEDKAFESVSFISAFGLRASAPVTATGRRA